MVLVVVSTINTIREAASRQEATQITTMTRATCMRIQEEVVDDKMVGEEVVSIMTIPATKEGISTREEAEGEAEDDSTLVIGDKDVSALP